ncbi:twin-arginine translocase TatA/TatE family subunit [Pararhodobacter sp.]|uniref:twin-arginine translocase TatA/TatE family subunit n=1 Tax=Pararhodobacter sp. TaxID=2127056 RepID=UPI002AFF57F0|nr:twin-arginine translocase TatA/TatE family subunit [Pararhodobacter sp.]
MATAQLISPLFINNIGPWGLLLIGIVVLVMFGRGKVAGLMGEFGKGITAFKRGVRDGSEEIENQADETTRTVRDVTPENNRDNA